MNKLDDYNLFWVLSTHTHTQHDPCLQGTMCYTLLRDESFRLSNCCEPKDHFGGLLKYRSHSLTSRDSSSTGLQEVQDSKIFPNTLETHICKALSSWTVSRSTTRAKRQHCLSTPTPTGFRENTFAVPVAPLSPRNKCNQNTPMWREQEEEKYFHQSSSQNGAT